MATALRQLLNDAWLILVVVLVLENAKFMKIVVITVDRVNTVISFSVQSSNASSAILR